MVPGMLAGILGYNFVNSCIDVKVEGTSATAIREIDGGKETLSASLPLIIGGQKGLVEEKDLRIPNMRGIMTARTKALTVLEPVASTVNTKAVKFEKPAPKSAVKLVSADNLDELVNLLHNEAKVI
jgi:electron transfer flavoprotein beta subunit